MSNLSEKGTKRKRFDTRPEKDPASKLAGKLYHLVKEVNKAAKKAKTFETQKAVKRLKAHRAKSSEKSEISELESQLDTLKNINHESIANLALYSKLDKDKILSRNPDVRHAISTQLKAPSKSNYSPAERRLLSSKTIASEVNAAISELRALVAPKKEDDENVCEEVSTGEGDVPTSRKRQKTAQPKTPKEHRTFEDQSVDITALNEGSEDDQPTGASEDDEGDSENPEDGNDDYDDVDADGWDGIASSSSDDGEDSDTPPKKANTVKHSTKQPSTSTSTSTFLPSLSVGYVRGGSDDSDLDDADADNAIGTRKNRRGQRARRAIWEKKFGKNANHVKKQRSDDMSHQSRVGSTNAPKGREPTSRIHSRRTDYSNETRASFRTSQDVSQHHKSHMQARQADEERLHPSWAAKRKLKEQQSMGIVPPQGKKIIFS